MINHLVGFQMYAATSSGVTLKVFFWTKTIVYRRRNNTISGRSNVCGGTAIFLVVLNTFAAVSPFLNV